MLEADNLLKALSNNNTANYKDENEDYDLGEILKFYDNKSKGHKFRCSDGTERFFTFD